MTQKLEASQNCPRDNKRLMLLTILVEVVDLMLDKRDDRVNEAQKDCENECSAAS